MRRCGQAAALEDTNRRLAEAERVVTAPGGSDAKVWGSSDTPGRRRFLSLRACGTAVELEREE